MEFTPLLDSSQRSTSKPVPFLSLAGVEDETFLQSYMVLPTLMSSLSQNNEMHDSVKNVENSCPGISIIMKMLAPPCGGTSPLLHSSPCRSPTERKIPLSKTASMPVRENKKVNDTSCSDVEYGALPTGALARDISLQTITSAVTAAVQHATFESILRLWKRIVIHHSTNPKRVSTVTSRYCNYHGFEVSFWPVCGRMPNSASVFNSPLQPVFPILNDREVRLPILLLAPQPAASMIAADGRLPSGGSTLVAQQSQVASCFLLPLYERLRREENDSLTSYRDSMHFYSPEATFSATRSSSDRFLATLLTNPDATSIVLSSVPVRPEVLARVLDCSESCFFPQREFIDVGPRLPDAADLLCRLSVVCGELLAGKNAIISNALLLGSPKNYLEERTMSRFSTGQALARLEDAERCGELGALHQAALLLLDCVNPTTFGSTAVSFDRRDTCFCLTSPFYLDLGFCANDENKGFGLGGNVWDEDNNTNRFISMGNSTADSNMPKPYCGSDSSPEWSSAGGKNGFLNKVYSWRHPRFLRATHDKAAEVLTETLKGYINEIKNGFFKLEHAVYAEDILMTLGALRVDADTHGSVKKNVSTFKLCEIEQNYLNYVQRTLARRSNSGAVPRLNASVATYPVDYTMQKYTVVRKLNKIMFHYLGLDMPPPRDNVFYVHGRENNVRGMQRANVNGRSYETGYGSEEDNQSSYGLTEEVKMSERPFVPISVSKLCSTIEFPMILIFDCNSAQTVLDACMAEFIREAKARGAYVQRQLEKLRAERDALMQQQQQGDSALYAGAAAPSGPVFSSSSDRFAHSSAGVGKGTGFTGISHVNLPSTNFLISTYNMFYSNTPNLTFAMTTEEQVRNRTDFFFFGSCAAGEHCPTNLHPLLPSDLFTSCLITQLKVALLWFIIQARSDHRVFANTDALRAKSQSWPPSAVSISALRSLSIEELNAILIHLFPGTTDFKTGRNTPLYELNRVFCAVTDSILWSCIPHADFSRLMRSDTVLASLFRGFILASRIMTRFSINCVSFPDIGTSHRINPMWETLDAAIGTLIAPVVKALRMPPMRVIMARFHRSVGALAANGITVSSPNAEALFLDETATEKSEEPAPVITELSPVESPLLDRNARLIHEIREGDRYVSPSLVEVAGDTIRDDMDMRVFLDEKYALDFSERCFPGLNDVQSSIFVMPQPIEPMLALSRPVTWKERQRTALLKNGAGTFFESENGSFSATKADNISSSARLSREFSEGFTEDNSSSHYRRLLGLAYASYRKRVQENSIFARLSLSLPSLRDYTAGGISTKGPRRSRAENKEIAEKSEKKLNSLQSTLQHVGSTANASEKAQGDSTGTLRSYYQRDENDKYKFPPYPFFFEQLRSIHCILDNAYKQGGSKKDASYLQITALPVVFYALLITPFRAEALSVLCRLLDKGPCAVMHCKQLNFFDQALTRFIEDDPSLPKRAAVTSLDVEATKLLLFIFTKSLYCDATLLPTTKFRGMLRLLVDVLKTLPPAVNPSKNKKKPNTPPNTDSPPSSPELTVAPTLLLDSVFGNPEILDSSKSGCIIGEYASVPGQHLLAISIILILIRHCALRKQVERRVRSERTKLGIPNEIEYPQQLQGTAIEDVVALCHEQDVQKYVLRLMSIYLPVVREQGSHRDYFIRPGSDLDIAACTTEEELASSVYWVSSRKKKSLESNHSGRHTADERRNKREQVLITLVGTGFALLSSLISGEAGTTFLKGGRDESKYDSSQELLSESTTMAPAPMNFKENVYFNCVICNLIENKMHVESVKFIEILNKQYNSYSTNLMKPNTGGESAENSPKRAAHGIFADITDAHDFTGERTCTSGSEGFEAQGFSRLGDTLSHCFAARARIIHIVGALCSLFFRRSGNFYISETLKAVIPAFSDKSSITRQNLWSFILTIASASYFPPDLAASESQRPMDTSNCDFSSARTPVTNCAEDMVSQCLQDMLSSCTAAVNFTPTIGRTASQVELPTVSTSESYSSPAVGDSLGLGEFSRDRWTFLVTFLRSQESISPTETAGMNSFIPVSSAPLPYVATHHNDHGPIDSYILMMLISLGWMIIKTECVPEIRATILTVLLRAFVSLGCSCINPLPVRRGSSGPGAEVEFGEFQGDQRRLKNNVERYISRDEALEILSPVIKGRKEDNFIGMDTSSDDSFAENEENDERKGDIEGRDSTNHHNHRSATYQGNSSATTIAGVSNLSEHSIKSPSVISSPSPRDKNAETGVNISAEGFYAINTDDANMELAALKKTIGSEPMIFHIPPNMVSGDAHLLDSRAARTQGGAEDEVSSFSSFVLSSNRGGLRESELSATTASVSADEVYDNSESSQTPIGVKQLLLEVLRIFAGLTSDFSGNSSDRGISLRCLILLSQLFSSNIPNVVIERSRHLALLEEKYKKRLLLRQQRVKEKRLEVVRASELNQQGSTVSATNRVSFPSNPVLHVGDNNTCSDSVSGSTEYSASNLLPEQLQRNHVPISASNRHHIKSGPRESSTPNCPGSRHMHSSGTHGDVFRKLGVTYGTANRHDIFSSRSLTSRSLNIQASLGTHRAQYRPQSRGDSRGRLHSASQLSLDAADQEKGTSASPSERSLVGSSASPSTRDNPPDLCFSYGPGGASLCVAVPAPTADSDRGSSQAREATQLEQGRAVGPGLQRDNRSDSEGQSGLSPFSPCSTTFRGGVEADLSAGMTSSVAVKNGFVPLSSILDFSAARESAAFAKLGFCTRQRIELEKLVRELTLFNLPASRDLIPELVDIARETAGLPNLAAGAPPVSGNASFVSENMKSSSGHVAGSSSYIVMSPTGVTPSTPAALNVSTIPQASLIAVSGTPRTARCRLELFETKIGNCSNDKLIRISLLFLEDTLLVENSIVFCGETSYAQQHADPTVLSPERQSPASSAVTGVAHSPQGRGSTKSAAVELVFPEYDWKYVWFLRGAQFLSMSEQFISRTIRKTVMSLCYGGMEGVSSVLGLNLYKLRQAVLTSGAGTREREKQQVVEDFLDHKITLSLDQVKLFDCFFNPGTLFSASLQDVCSDKLYCNGAEQLFCSDGQDENDGSLCVQIPVYYPPEKEVSTQIKSCPPPSFHIPFPVSFMRAARQSSLSTNSKHLPFLSIYLNCLCTAISNASVELADTVLKIHWILAQNMKESEKDKLDSLLSMCSEEEHANILTIVTSLFLRNPIVHHVYFLSCEAALATAAFEGDGPNRASVEGGSLTALRSNCLLIPRAHEVSAATLRGCDQDEIQEGALSEGTQLLSIASESRSPGEPPSSSLSATSASQNLSGNEPSFSQPSAFNRFKTCKLSSQRGRVSSPETLSPLSDRMSKYLSAGAEKYKVPCTDAVLRFIKTLLEKIGGEYDLASPAKLCITTPVLLYRLPDKCRNGRLIAFAPSVDISSCTRLSAFSRDVTSPLAGPQDVLDNSNRAANPLRQRLVFIRGCDEIIIFDSHGMTLPVEKEELPRLSGNVTTYHLSDLGDVAFPYFLKEKRDKKEAGIERYLTSLSRDVMRLQNVTSESFRSVPNVCAWGLGSATNYGADFPNFPFYRENEVREDKGHHGNCGSPAHYRINTLPFERNDVLHAAKTATTVSETSFDSFRGVPTPGVVGETLLGSQDPVMNLHFVDVSSGLPMLMTVSAMGTVTLLANYSCVHPPGDLHDVDERRVNKKCWFKALAIEDSRGIYYNAEKVMWGDGSSVTEQLFLSHMKRSLTRKLKKIRCFHEEVGTGAEGGDRELRAQKANGRVSRSRRISDIAYFYVKDFCTARCNTNFCHSAYQHSLHHLICTNGGERGDAGTTHQSRVYLWDMYALRRIERRNVTEAFQIESKPPVRCERAHSANRDSTFDIFYSADKMRKTKIVMPSQNFYSDSQYQPPSFSLDAVSANLTNPFLFCVGANNGVVILLDTRVDTFALRIDTMHQSGFLDCSRTLPTREDISAGGLVENYEKKVADATCLDELGISLNYKPFLLDLSFSIVSPYSLFVANRQGVATIWDLRYMYRNSSDGGALATATRAASTHAVDMCPAERVGSAFSESLNEENRCPYDFSVDSTHFAAGNAMRSSDMPGKWAGQWLPPRLPICETQYYFAPPIFRSSRSFVASGTEVVREWDHSSFSHPCTVSTSSGNQSGSSELKKKKYNILNRVPTSVASIHKMSSSFPLVLHAGPTHAGINTTGLDRITAQNSSLEELGGSARPLAAAWHALALVGCLSIAGTQENRTNQLLEKSPDGGCFLVLPQNEHKSVEHSILDDIC